jgi:hypothetical protein
MGSEVEMGSSQSQPVLSPKSDTETRISDGVDVLGDHGDVYGEPGLSDELFEMAAHVDEFGMEALDADVSALLRRAARELRVNHSVRPVAWLIENRRKVFARTNPQTVEAWRSVGATITELYAWGARDALSGAQRSELSGQLRDEPSSPEEPTP